MSVTQATAAQSGATNMLESATSRQTRWNPPVATSFHGYQDGADELKAAVRG